MCSFSNRESEDSAWLTQLGEEHSRAELHQETVAKHAGPLVGLRNGECSEATTGLLHLLALSAGGAEPSGRMSWRGHVLRAGPEDSPSPRPRRRYFCRDASTEQGAWCLGRRCSSSRWKGMFKTTRPVPTDKLRQHFLFLFKTLLSTGWEYRPGVSRGVI